MHSDAMQGGCSCSYLLLVGAPSLVLRIDAQDSPVARIAGGALILAAELIPNPNIDLFISAYILQWAGLAPLMLSTLGFLGLAYVTKFNCTPI